LAERSKAETFLILGVAHAAPPVPFILGEKDYDTPLGKVPVDRDVVSALKKRVPDWGADHEGLHRTEHSIEFQAVFLKYCLGGRPFRIVPILCSAFEPLCDSKSPQRVPSIEDRVGALCEAFERGGEQVAVVSGADLAHVGPRFGDREPVSKELVRWMEDEDLKSLTHAEKGRAEDFYQSVVADGNRRKVCGLSSIYSALRLLNQSGSVLRYGFAPDPAGGIVSFASMVYPGRGPGSH
jgi:AmmeMemoRadiSam system protein B